jgi:hypothetical protein
MAVLLWVVVGVLLAVWSAVVWLGQLLLSALLNGAGHLPVKDLALPEAWTRWIPQGVSESITQALEAAQPLLQTALDTMPALSSGVTVLAWVTWVVGTGLLLLAGGASHAGLRWWQRHQQAQAPRATYVPS